MMSISVAFQGKVVRRTPIYQPAMSRIIGSAGFRVG
jgi:hypothetical protein